MVVLFVSIVLTEHTSGTGKWLITSTAVNHLRHGIPIFKYVYPSVLQHLMTKIRMGEQPVRWWSSAHGLIVGMSARPVRILSVALVGSSWTHYSATFTSLQPYTRNCDNFLLKKEIVTTNYGCVRLQRPEINSFLKKKLQKHASFGYKLWFA